MPKAAERASPEPGGCPGCQATCSPALQGFGLTRGRPDQGEEPSACDYTCVAGPSLRSSERRQPGQV